MKFVTEKQVAKSINVRYDTVRRWISIYKPGAAQGVYHFGRAVRIERETFIKEFPAFLERQRAAR
jgi:transposase